MDRHLVTVCVMKHNSQLNVYFQMMHLFVMKNDMGTIFIYTLILLNFEESVGFFFFIVDLSGTHFI